MRFRPVIFLLALLLTSFCAFAQDEGEVTFPDEQKVQQPTATPPVDEDTKTDNTEEAAETPPPEEEAPATPPPRAPIVPKTAPESETGLDDEGLFEDAEPEQPATTEDKTKPASNAKRVELDAVVIVKYIFANTNESYTVKYHINLGGDINADVGLVKGSAKIATDISGFLAKTSAFECMLKVSIADVPFELMFKKASDTEAEMSVSFKGQILEDWESMCTFLDTTKAKFNTRGSPEQWIALALDKAKPPLNKLTISVDPAKVSTSKFMIPKYTVQDEGLGSAEIEGTGVITIKPKLPTAPAEEESRLLKQQRKLAAIGH